MRTLLLLILSIILLAGCGGEETIPPDQVVNDYWTLIEKGKHEEARMFVVEGKEEVIGTFNFRIDEELGEEIAGFDEVFQDRFKLVATGYKINDEIAIADVMVTKPNLKVLLGKYFEEAFPEIMTMVFEGASEEEIDQKMEAILMDVLKETDDITHEEKAELHLIDGEWKIYSWHFDKIEQRMEEIDEGLEGLGELENDI